MPFQFRKEAIEEDLNTNFPSQGQGNPPLYYQLSEVVVPTYSINAVAEGSGGNLPQNLQTAWDFSTGNQVTRNTTDTLITNPGFWLIDTVFTGISSTTVSVQAQIFIDDGVSEAVVYEVSTANLSVDVGQLDSNKFVVFLRSGDELKQTTDTDRMVFSTWYRQIADVNGNLVNPLGFSFA